MDIGLGTEEVTALLLDGYDTGPLTPDVYHPLVYFAEQELKKDRVTVSIPKFWYTYGIHISTATTDVEFKENEDGVLAATYDTPVSELDLSERTLSRGQRAVNRALNHYQDEDVDALRNDMYDAAPYDIQREMRQLRILLQSAADPDQLVLDGRQNRARTRDVLYDILDRFPFDEYPSYLADVLVWYRLMSSALDSENYDASRAKAITEGFWQLFCLEIARTENEAIDAATIERELEIESLDAAKQELRASLHAEEREKATRNASSADAAVYSGESVVIPHLDGELTLED